MNSIPYDKLPRHLRAGMERWIEEGILPGGTLRMILSNDLMAVCSADSETLAAMPSIMRWIYSEAPSQCWGSADALKTWKGQGA